jgi:hypothetical protein
MRILRNVMLAFGLVALAAACGGKSKAADNTMDNTGGGDTGGGDMGGDAYGGDMYGGDMGGDPCGGMGADPCEGAE